MINIEKLPEYDTHELVVRLHDQATGLRGFIAIHNTNRGPAVGGTRFWHYKNEEEALRDALRLSQAMTYKCALANVPYGGGKAVLIAPKNMSVDMKTEEYIRAYTKRLGMLDGHFFTGEDVGMTEHDIEVLAKFSTSIIGRPSVGELPSRWAALSVFHSMRASLKLLYGNDSFDGKTVAVKGLGNVGSDLCEMLFDAGAQVYGADVNPERVQQAQARFPKLKIVAPAEIHRQKVDIYSPCALGHEFTDKAIKQLACRIVCGAANNQLPSPKASNLLAKKNIVYVPDYIANAGGLIDVVDELEPGGYSHDRVEQNVAKVYDTTLQILTEALEKKKSPAIVADRIGKERFTLTT